MARVRPVGEPANEAEREVIRTLAEKLPRDYIVLHNLQVGEQPRGRPVELDVVVIGEHAVYCIEVKDWHGAIQGNAYEWSLAPDDRRPSPLGQVNVKARIVSRVLERKNALFRRVEVVGLVLIPDPRTAIRLPRDVSAWVTHLAEAPALLTRKPPTPSSEFLKTSIQAQTIGEIAEALVGKAAPSRSVQTLGNYQIVEKIGETDSYTEYLASHQLLKRRQRVRLKVYRVDPYLNAQQRERQQRLITRDMNAITTLEDHPNILKAYEVFTLDNDKVCVVTEWFGEGQTLRSLLDRGTPLTLEELGALFGQICAGLRFAHDRGVLHRNLAPENILVAPEDQRVKLTNFDYSRIQGLDTISGPAQRFGDQRYVAPEQWLNSLQADHRADIYSLGVVTYEALTGQLPYPNAGVALQGEGPIPLRELAPHVSSVLVRLVHQMIEVDPDRRPRSVMELQDAARPAFQPPRAGGAGRQRAERWGWLPFRPRARGGLPRDSANQPNASNQ